jgi:hypothetical protein
MMREGCARIERELGSWSPKSTASEQPMIGWMP